VNIHLTHQEDALQQRADWFRAQAGCAQLLCAAKQPDADLPVLRITRSRSELAWNQECLRFHPSLALLRVMNVSQGQPDRFLQATQLRPGDTCLDLTLGLATDALVAAWTVGEAGRVIGVERSPLLGALVREGLSVLAEAQVPVVKNACKQRAWMALRQAASRIAVIWAEHGAYLAEQAADAVDVVYFDPMFRHTRKQSSAIRPLYDWAELSELQEEAVRQACRVARRRVVMKERKGSGQFARLGFTVSSGGKYSEVDFGVIEVHSCNR
jgi:hypothetical protein